MIEVDINCDLGEGCGADADVMPWITSANIACGAHAGNPSTMWHTLQLAQRQNVRIGAHPGFPDRNHFGRREIRLPTSQLFVECVSQIGGLFGLARACQATVQYVKPHGALYNMACRDRTVAQPVVEAAAVYNLPVMGLPNSALEEATRTKGLAFIREGFADRRYLADGTLVPRSRPDALITDPAAAVAQVRILVEQLQVQSVCVHGDQPGVTDFVRQLREHLIAA